MIRPEVLAYVSSDTVRDPSWSAERCACGVTRTRDGCPEVRIWNTVHGILCCMQYATEQDAADAMAADSEVTCDRSE